MPKDRIFRVKNLDDLFNQSFGARIINSSTFTSSNVLEDFVKQMFYELDNDLEYVSSCECGEYRGNYYEGFTCPYCQTVVSSKFTTSLVNINWLEIPPEFPAVIHPVFFTIFKEWLGKTRSVKGARNKKVPIIQAILNPADPLPDDIRHIVPIQGQKYFNEHYEEILHYFLHDYRPKKGNRFNPYIEYMLEKYRGSFLVRRLPILHPSMHPLSKDGKIKTVEVTSSTIFPAINDLSHAGNTARRKVITDKYIDKTIWKVYSKYIEYTENIVVKRLGDKFGHLRRHMLGSRVHFSGRTVIVPITDRHMGDEVYMPWKIMVNNMKHEIINVLMNRRGYSYNDAITKHIKSLVIYDQDIYDILMELMEESGGSISVLVGRNPTLIHGAIQKLRITKVKTNLADNTLSFSPRICNAPL